MRNINHNCGEYKFVRRAVFVLGKALEAMKKWCIEDKRHGAPTLPMNIDHEIDGIGSGQDDQNLYAAKKMNKNGQHQAELD